LIGGYHQSSVMLGPGLVWSTFEESFSGPSHMLGEKGFSRDWAATIAATDTNIAVAVGAYDVAALAEVLGDADDAGRYRAIFAALSDSINRYLWNEQTVLITITILRKALSNGLSVTTFNALRLQIAPKPRRERLFRKLLDSKQFNWGKRRLPVGR